MPIPYTTVILYVIVTSTKIHIDQILTEKVFLTSWKVVNIIFPIFGKVIIFRSMAAISSKVEITIIQEITQCNSSNSILYEKSSKLYCNFC